MFCFLFFVSKSNISDQYCTPLFLSKSIDCSCETQLGSDNTVTNHLGVIIPVVVIILIILIVFSVVLYERFSLHALHKEPEEQLNLVVCTADNAEYEYNLIFRVGCATGDFDMKNGYIDFEILGPDKDIIGTPVR